MANLVLSGFPTLHLDIVRNLLGRNGQLSVLATSHDAEALNALHAGVSVAYCPFWSAAPTAQQLETVQHVSQQRIPVIPVLGSQVAAVAKLEAIRAGALDCVTLDSLEGRFVQLVELFASRSVLIEKSVRQRIESTQGSQLVLESPEMIELVSRLSRVATLSSTILLTGETGVGKSTLARWIHDHSARRQNPFVAVQCAAIPANMVETELFGQARGMNAGIDRNQEGKFSLASNGTLLLDEIDCLPLEVQSKLLRVVEQKQFERLGSSATERFEARLIVATNRPLDSLVEQGRFRSDLFYRLGVLSFRVPALRERQQDIGPLAVAFRKRFTEEYNYPTLGISPSALHTLQEFPWPGNVRELRNAMEYAVALATGNQIEWHDLPEDIRYPRESSFANLKKANGDYQPLLSIHGAHGSATSMNPDLVSSGNQLAKAREDAERDKLLSTLRLNNFNRTKAAAALGISRVTLYKRMLKLNLLSGLAH